MAPNDTHFSHAITCKQLLLAGTPDLHHAVQPAGDDLLAVAGENQARDGLHVGLDGVDVLAAGDVPDLDGLVPAGAGELGPIGAVYQRPDAVGRLELLQLLAAVGVENLDQSFEVAGSQMLAVRAEGE